MIQTEQVEDRGVEIVERRGVLHGLETEVVARAVARARFHASAHEKTREGVRVVVAARAVGLEKRHATEFRAPDDERVFE